MRFIRSAAVALMAALAILLAGSVIATPPAHAGDTPSATWTGTNAYGFAVGDSLLHQCGEEFGMSWRSLGYVGWPGATSRTMRDRLTAQTEGWDWTTEPSNAWERIWFRDAGFLVVSLGTNDVKFLTVEEWRDNVNWFMGQSRGRPVIWMDINNPFFQPAVDVFNAELHAATDRYPNLKVVPWERFVRENPGVVQADRVHVSTDAWCRESRDRLIRHAAPDIPGHTKPQGFWYWNPSRTGPVVLNGWGAGNSDSRQVPIAVNVRSDGGHVGRVPLDRATGDIWANAASGRGFGFTLTENFRGHYVCLDLVDAREQFTSLGCRVIPKA